MRKLKLAMYVSLYGVVENPAWTAPFWDDGFHLERYTADKHLSTAPRAYRS